MLKIMSNDLSFFVLFLAICADDLPLLVQLCVSLFGIWQLNLKTSFRSRLIARQAQPFFFIKTCNIRSLLCH